MASRTASGLDAARAALSETLDAYRGAEARQATEVTKVLTVYAAVMLPLSLIAGFFGMNHTNLPDDRLRVGVVGGRRTDDAGRGGVDRRVRDRRVGATTIRADERGRRWVAGLLEAARAPVQVAGAVYEISSLPLRTAMIRRSKPES